MYSTWYRLVYNQEQRHDDEEEEGGGGDGVGGVAEVALAEAHELPLVVLLHISTSLLVVTWGTLQALTLCCYSKVVVAEVFISAF